MRMIICDICKKEMSRGTNFDWEEKSLNAAISFLRAPGYSVYADVCKNCQIEFMKSIIKNSIGTIIVEVYGGVADVTQCPDWIDIEIIDNDNLMG